MAMSRPHLRLLCTIVLILTSLCVACCGRLRLWPLPKSYTHDPSVSFQLVPSSFTFETLGYTNDILQRGIERYKKIIFGRANDPQVVGGISRVSSPQTATSKNSFAILQKLQIQVNQPKGGTVNEQIQYGTNESYRLKVDPSSGNSALLHAPNVFAALRGLETFSQMISKDGQQYTIDKWDVNDSPRFPWRGLLIDTSRHFLPVGIILDIIEAMSYDKLNVLHWHVVDGQSFPLQSTSYPLLAEKGAYSFPELSYSPEDVDAIVKWANDRGVRVLPEFDMPAHATSWGYGYPWLIMNCSMFKNECKASPRAPHNYNDGCADDPFDPTNPKTYELLSGFLEEMAQRFPDNFLHLGGDELQYRIQCWNISRINEWMKDHGFSTGDYYGLQNYFVQQTRTIAEKLPKTLVHWQELFNEKMTLGKDSIIQVWKDHKTLDEVVRAGFYGTLSFGWYLDNLSANWEDMYNNEPYDGTLPPEEQARILGGEAAMWGEMVDKTNVRSRIWPRTSAVAERLWSPMSVNNASLAAPRLHDQRCRFVHRGYPARPLGPGWCYP